MVDPVAPPASVIVSVKSAWTSKINWAQVVSAAAVMVTLSTGGQVNLSPSEQLAVVTAISVLSNVVTIVFKTYFTKSVTAESMK